MATFASDRAERQVECLLDYAAFPGKGVLIDATGNVLVERGELSGAAARRLAAVASALEPGEDVRPVERDALVRAGVPDDHYGLAIGLRAGYRLCIVVPEVVAASKVQPRVVQARDKLVAMMRPLWPGPYGGAPGEGGAPSSANALWTFATSPGDHAEWPKSTT